VTDCKDTEKLAQKVAPSPTVATALRRILHAIHMAEPDDTIVIVPGLYDQDLAKHIAAARAAGV
jgi:hypothetical protein